MITKIYDSDELKILTKIQKEQTFSKFTLCAPSLRPVPESELCDPFSGDSRQSTAWAVLLIMGLEPIILNYILN